MTAGNEARRSPVLPVVIAFTVITLVALVYSILHEEGTPRPCGRNEVPSEGYAVISTIQDGGPFDYPDNDGQRFGNYEGELPEQPKGYYREYTVTTPGLGHRGERRIVTGGGTPEHPDVYYYTADHYQSFCEVTTVD